MLGNILSRLRGHHRLFIRPFERDLVAQGGGLVGEGNKELNRCFIFRQPNDRGFLPQSFRLSCRHRACGKKMRDRLGELSWLRRMSEDLAGGEKTDYSLAEPNRDRRFSQAERTDERARGVAV